MANSEAALNFVGPRLASAIALKASGHNLLVLEKEPHLGGTLLGLGGFARVPPNGCKIIFDWGLEIQTRANAAIGRGFAVYKSREQMTGERRLIGILLHQDLLHILDDEVMKPTEQAQANLSVSRVTVLFGAEVVNIDFNGCSIHTSDAIIGADGVWGVVRRTLIQKENTDPRTCDVPTGMALYAAVVPGAFAVEHPDLVLFSQDPESTMERVPTEVSEQEDSIVFPDLIVTYLRRRSDILGGRPDSSQDATWAQEAQRKLTDVLGSCDSQFRKIAGLAGPSTRVQIQNYYKLDSWISENGRVLVLREAAHPFSTEPSSDRYSPILGSSYMRLNNIGRRSRCHRIREIEKQYIEVIMLGDGEMQKVQDSAMRANTASGRNVMDPSPEPKNLQQILDDTRMMQAPRNILPINFDLIIH
ncbi:hypothetical protein B0H17DRAFT_1136011 [Mycena rosella]|uniref:FAD-binding domain-containing protein n=1 Tax=Mycena rosella TaxID=1033263 RepID=A0AAD7DC40_MYCRO|nr:hypothetical protein B0H17DRAFT_1136011 [Mycena rosella]